MSDEHTHTLDWDSQRLRDVDEDRHAHRDDLSPEMVRADPLFSEDPEGNPFFVDLCQSYRDESVARCLWATATEGTVP